jgi:hypothetical protein
MSAGGVFSASVDEGSTAAAHFAVKELGEKNSLTTSLLSLVEIKSVKSQLVAGTNYIMELVVSDGEKKTFEVEVTVWSRPWLAGKNDAENPAMALTTYKLLDRDS